MQKTNCKAMQPGHVHACMLLQLLLCVLLLLVLSMHGCVCMCSADGCGNPQRSACILLSWLFSKVAYIMLKCAHSCVHLSIFDVEHTFTIVSMTTQWQHFPAFCTWQVIQRRYMTPGSTSTPT
jgi:hypothetical protein